MLADLCGLENILVMDVGRYGFKIGSITRSRRALTMWITSRIVGVCLKICGRNGLIQSSI